MDYLAKLRPKNVTEESDEKGMIKNGGLAEYICAILF